MNAIELIVGVLILPLSWGGIWVLSRSPLLAWFVSLVCLAMWGLLPIGIWLFVTFAVHLPKGNYGVVIGGLALVAGISLPWVTLGVPALSEKLRSAKAHFILWK